MFSIGVLFLRSQESLRIEDILKKYPNELIVYISKNEKYNLDIVKGKLKITKSFSEKFLISRNAFNTVRNIKVRTSNFIKVDQLEAHIHVYNGKSHSKKKLTDIVLKSEDDLKNGVFYDGDEFYIINFFEAKGGDIIEVSYTETYQEPQFFGALFFAEYYPVLHRSGSINYSNDINVVRKEFNNQKVKFDPKIESDKKRTSISWSFDSLKPIVDEEKDGSYKNKSSYVLFSIENYKTKDSIVQVAGTAENLYSWYSKLLEKIDVIADSSVIKLSDSLTTGVKTDLEKLKRIFYWVEGKIAYLAYEDGLGGYIPRESSLVCKRKYGDCKDMANLIVQLCKAANLPVYPTWIGTTDIPHQFSEFPTAYCSNHMIATYVTSNDTIFLDATGRFYPFGLPTSMIQGKEGFIGVDKNKFMIAKVPTINKLNNIVHDSVILCLKDNNDIKGRGYYKLAGYEKTDLMSYFEDKSYEWQKGHLVKLLQKGNNKFSIDTFSVKKVAAEEPYVITYTFTIRDHVSQNKGEKYVNLNFFRDYFDQFLISGRMNGFYLQYAGRQKLTVNFELTNCIANELPEDVEFKNEITEYKVKYQNSKTNIIFENTIDINKTNILPDEFKDLEIATSNYKKTKSKLVTLITVK